MGRHGNQCQCARCKGIRGETKGMRTRPLGYKHSQETKDKIGKANSIVLKGRKLSKAIKRKISQSMKKHIFTDIHKNRISKALKGRKYSANTIKKMSIARKGKAMPQKIRNKISNTFKTRNIFDNHHLFTKEISDYTIRIDHRKHIQLHHKAYEYLIQKFGKQGILDYLSWFNKKYVLDVIINPEVLKFP
jgi:hypothetical protein